MPLHTKLDFFSQVLGFKTIRFDSNEQVLTIDASFPLLKPDSLNDSDTHFGPLSKLLTKDFYQNLESALVTLKYGGIVNFIHHIENTNTAYECIVISLKHNEDEFNFELGVCESKTAAQNTPVVPMILHAINSINEAVVISDHQQKDEPLVYINEAFLRMTGFQKEEILGQNCRFLQNSESKNEQQHANNKNSLTILKKAIAQGKATVVELINFTKAGKPFLNELSIAPIKDTNETVTNFVGVQRNVTEVRDLMDQTNYLYRQYKGLFDQSPIPLYTVDDNGIIWQMNDRLCEHTQLSQESLRGTSHLELFDPSILAEMHIVTHSDLINHMNTDGVVELKTGLQKMNVSRWVLFQAVAEQDPKDNRVYYLCAWSGFNKTKAIEIEQLLLIDKLQESNFQLQRFAHIASHDLQAPINKVTNLLYLIEDDIQHKKPVSPTYIAKAINASAQMKDLITDLLHESKSNTLLQDLCVISAETCVKQALDNLESLISHANVDLQVGNLPSIFANAMQISRLFQNLISNAIEYRTLQNPTIKISGKTDGEYSIFSIEDNGKGIPDEKKQSVFEYLTRLHNNPGGHGMGLSICKQIVRRHNGKIWVEDSPLGGCKFTFSLPRAKNKLS